MPRQSSATTLNRGWPLPYPEVPETFFTVVDEFLRNADQQVRVATRQRILNGDL